MDLNKTINNIKITNEGFFNLKDFFINYDTYKFNITYFYQKYGDEFIFLSDTKIIKYSLKSCFRVKEEYIFINMITSEYKYNSQLYHGNYYLAKEKCKKIFGIYV